MTEPTNGNRMIPMVLVGVAITAIGGGVVAYARIASLETALATELARSLATDNALEKRLEDRQAEFYRRSETYVTREQFREELEDFRKQRAELLELFHELQRQQRAMEVERRDWTPPGGRP